MATAALPSDGNLACIAAETRNNLVQELQSRNHVLDSQVGLATWSHKPELPNIVSLNQITKAGKHTAPSRYCTTATIDCVASASFIPSKPGSVAEPTVNEPP